MVLKIISHTVFHFYNFLRETSYILNSVVSHAPPRVYEIEITNHCAGQCIMCPKTYILTRKLNHMPLDLFKHIVSQLSHRDQIECPGGSLILRLFHYGDLCLYPQAYEAISFAKQKGFYVVSSSMAALFTREKAIETIEAGLDEIWLMLDGMDEKTSIKIRGKAASFEKSLENIDFLVNFKKSKNVVHPKIYVFMIRQPANSDQWGKFKDFFKNMYPEVHSHLAYFSNFGGNIPEINTMLNGLREMNGQPEEDERVKRLNSYRCYYPWHSVCVLSDGRVVPCCRDMNGDYILGDLQNKPLRAIWNDEPLRNLRKEWIHGKIRNSLCVTCTEANNEIGLPAQSFPFFHVFDRLSPQRFRNSKADYYTT